VEASIRKRREGFYGGGGMVDEGGSVRGVVGCGNVEVLVGREEMEGGRVGDAGSGVRAAGWNRGGGWRRKRGTEGRRKDVGVSGGSVRTGCEWG